jgi:uncharacterized membrane protein YfhO
VHETEVAPSRETLLSRLGAPGVDPHRTALLASALDANLEPLPDGPPEEVTVGHYQQNKLGLSVKARSRGLLVLSENFYPGWQAGVNGRPARIYEVDGALRGIVVDAGENRVVLDYAPAWLAAGALLTFAAFGGTLVGFLLLRRRA